MPKVPVGCGPWTLGSIFGARGWRQGSRRGLTGLIANGVIGLGLLGLATGSSIVGSFTYTPDEIVPVTATVGAPVAGQAFIGTTLSRYGTVLVDRNGNVLYTQEFETKAWKGELVGCKESDCAKYWKPAPATSFVTAQQGVTTASVGAVKRAHGVLQLTYAGYALYTYPGDTPGSFIPFSVQNTQDEGGGPKFTDWHVVTVGGEILPPLSAVR